MTEYFQIEEDRKGHGNKRRPFILRPQLKKALIYIAIITVTLFTLTRLDLIKRQDDSNVNRLPTFSITSEMDPATWPIQVKEREPVYLQNSIFPSIVFDKNNENGYPPVTAIIHRIDDTNEGIIHAVRHLTKYSFVKEIFIYNQIKSRPLTTEQFYINSTITTKVHIEIIQTEASIDNMGKFTACAVATYDRCYFQDDLWLNPYLDSIYTHFQRYPYQFVVNTRPVNYIDYKKWRFTSREISLHTGYADLRYGAFILREKVQTFLSQLSSQGLEAYKLKHADIYFSIWLNQYPYMISNPLLSNGRDRFKDVDTVNNRELIEYFMYDALSILESSLKNSNSVSVEDDYFDKEELTPNESEKDVRSSCSNDRCLFITNMDTMPNVDNIRFSSITSSNFTEYDTLYNATNPVIPSQTSFIRHSYHKAVDQNTETCWKSIESPKEEDYFGLYMTGDIRAKRVMLYTSNTFDKPLNQILKVTVQYRIYESWEECSIKLTPNSQLSYRIGFDFVCPVAKESFKSIRITFREEQQKPLEICGFGLDNFVV